MFLGGIMFTFKTKLSMAKAVLTKDSPFYVQFYVSKYCNLNCKMCNIVEANSDLEPFGSEEIGRIADNLVKIGVGVVLLTGGEPFLRNDIDEIVRIFKSKKLDVRLQTAGLIAKKDKMAKCAEYGARDISVSIDSLDEGLSDYINGVNGSWKNAIKTISFVTRTFPQKDTIYALGCVLSRYNIDEIEPVLDFATEIGWWVSLVPVHITNPETPLNFRGYDEFFKFREEDLPKVKALVERLKKKKRQGYNLFDSDNYLDSVYHFIKAGTPNWRYKGICDSPNMYFVILPDASFAPCCDFRFNKKIYVYDKDFLIISVVCMFYSVLRLPEPSDRFPSHSKQPV
jgi:MoaA/NifB/PqqE/SkfB family radical SAM enzyme